MTQLLLRQAIAEAVRRDPDRNPGGLLAEVIQQYLDDPPAKPDETAINMLVALQLVERRDGQLACLPLPADLWGGQ